MKRPATMTRTARFVAIGWLGFAVQMAVLAALTALARWPWLPATCVAVEAAIVHNYLWHERWTWRDRVESTPIRARVARFAKYNAATGLVSIAGNVALTGLFVEMLQLPVVIANLLAVIALTIANFAVADRWIFPRLPGSAAFLSALMLLTPASASAQPSPETAAAWNRYVAQLERRIDTETRALQAWAPAGPPATDVSGETIDVPSGAIHHWRGAVFVPGVTVDRMLDDLLHSKRAVVEQEDVAESRTLSRTDDSVRTYIKLVRRAIVTVTYDTEHEMTFRRWSPSFATARSVATSIREAGGSDHGFLWRLNSYWTYRQVADGVVVELESITLSRSIPGVIRPVAMPIIHHIARESMARTLGTFRARFVRADS